MDPRWFTFNGDVDIPSRFQTRRWRSEELQQQNRPQKTTGRDDTFGGALPHRQPGQNRLACCESNVSTEKAFQVGLQKDVVQDMFSYTGIFGPIAFYQTETKS